jgi:hypothetical protein
LIIAILYISQVATNILKKKIMQRKPNDTTREEEIWWLQNYIGGKVRGKETTRKTQM